MKLYVSMLVRTLSRQNLPMSMLKSKDSGKITKILKTNFSSSSNLKVSSFFHPHYWLTALLLTGPVWFATTSSSHYYCDSNPDFNSRIYQRNSVGKTIQADAATSDNNNSSCHESNRSNNDENDNSDNTHYSEFQEIPGDYIAIFLDSPSIQLLKVRFPQKYDHSKCDHMTVMFQPARTDIWEQDELFLGRVTLRVIGHAIDDHAQAILVDLDHHSPDIATQNQYNHITLSIADNKPDSQYAAKYSNVLLSRIATQTSLYRMDYAKDNLKTPQIWRGTLPETRLYEPSEATWENVQHENITVSGTYCLHSKWDSQSFSCSYVHRLATRIREINLVTNDDVCKNEL